MNTIERKWRANMEKVKFAGAFPDRLDNRDDAGDRQIHADILIDPDRAFMVAIYSDGSYVIEIEDREPFDDEILEALLFIRPQLEPFQREAYAKLDKLTAIDRELTRLARKENILGAIRNNIAAIPELFEEIPRLLDQLRGGG